MIDLWLDDERDPDDPRIQEAFNAQPGMRWVKSAASAIRWLKQGNVLSISLDHDLGTNDTGYDVAKWIEERAFRGEMHRIQWTIHSMNVAGAKKMEAALQNADRFWSLRDRAAEVAELPPEA